MLLHLKTNKKHLITLCYAADFGSSLRLEHAVSSLSDSHQKPDSSLAPAGCALSPVVAVIPEVLLKASGMPPDGARDVVLPAAVTDHLHASAAVGQKEDCYLAVMVTIATVVVIVMSIFVSLCFAKSDDHVNTELTGRYVRTLCDSTQIGQ